MGEVISRREFLALCAGMAMAWGLGVPRKSSAHLDVPTILLTGFEPFGGKETNSSSVIVELLAALAKRKLTPFDEAHFLPNLPVDDKNQGRAADIVEEYVRQNLPDGCIVISLGEAYDLTQAHAAARLERFAKQRTQNDASANHQIWMHTEEFYDLVIEYFAKNHALIFAQNPELNLIFSKTEDTAGGYVCENLLFRLFQKSKRLAKTRTPLFPVFIHVPAFEGRQCMEATLQTIIAVSLLAKNFWTLHASAPESLVAVISPDSYTDESF